MQDKTPLLIGFDGLHLDDGLKEHLWSVNPYGVILFRRNIQSLEQTKELIKEIQDFLGGTLVAIDHEGGLVNRFGRLAPVPPSAHALGVKGERALNEEAGFMMASVLAELGIRMNFAPVLDLYDSASKAIGHRAYSTKSQEVVDYGRSVMEEHLKLGVVPVGKHFPGHGRVEADSHFQEGRVTRTRMELQEDLQPFREMIGHGIPAMMTAHLIYEAYDKEHPATLSKGLGQDLLRGELGFEGVLISDCLEMAATAQSYGPAEMARLGHEAGLDLWMSSFSLLKSREFQLELAEELRKYTSPARFARLDNLRQIWHLSEFAPPAPSDEDCLKLHEVCLEVVREEPLGECKGLFLAELVSKGNEGVNAGEAWSSFSERLLVGQLPIMEKKAFAKPDPMLLASFAEQARKQGACLLLVTWDGFKKIGYQALFEDLPEELTLLQIALGGAEDLWPGAMMQWACHGYNDWTGTMLLQRLQEYLSD